MRVGTEIGHRGRFQGKRIYTLRAHEIGKRRCAECYFQDRPEACVVLQCHPLMHTDIIYRRSKKGYNTNENSTDYDD